MESGACAGFGTDRRATGRITTIADSVMANLLGLGEVGKASGLTIDLPVHSLNLSAENCSATRGRFSYAFK